MELLLLFIVVQLVFHTKILKTLYNPCNKKNHTILSPITVFCLSVISWINSLLFFEAL